MSKKRKHIAIVTYGGIGTGKPMMSKGIPIILAFVNRLSQEYNITVFSLSPINKGFAASNFQIRAPKNKMSFIDKFLWLFKNFYTVHRQSTICLIHVIWGFPQGTFAVLLKWFFSIPVIIHLQGGDSTYLPEIDYGAFRSFWHSKVISWTYRHSDELVVLTKYQKAQLEKYFVEKEAIIIPFGLKSDTNKPSISPLTPPYRLIHIGHISPVKDQLTLIKAFEKITEELDCTLTIIGGDTMSGSLNTYVDHHNIASQVFFTGELAHEEAMCKLENAHILIHSSIYEAQGVVVNEALVNAVAVCGTHVGLIADLTGNCTLSSPVRDEKALSQNVIQLLKNERQYYEQINNGIIWSNEHTAEYTFTMFENIYSRYLK